MQKQDALQQTKALWKTMSTDHFYRLGANSLLSIHAKKLNSLYLKKLAHRINDTQFDDTHVNHCSLCEWTLTIKTKVDCSICPLATDNDCADYFEWRDIVLQIQKDHYHERLQPFSPLFTAAAKVAKRIVDKCHSDLGLLKDCA
jgi:hypothetical protein